MNLDNGLKEICYSLSGTFSLITLIVLAVVSWHTNSPIALAAFASIIPAVLALAPMAPHPHSDIHSIHPRCGTWVNSPYPH